LKKLLALMLVFILSLCSCSDADTTKEMSNQPDTGLGEKKVVDNNKKSGKKDAKPSKVDIAEKICGYWVCHDSKNGEEFISVIDDVYTRGVYSTNGDSANITEITSNDKDTLTITFACEDSNVIPYPYTQRKQQYTVTLYDEYGFDEHFLLKENNTDYHFYRVANSKTMCDFMLNSNNPRVSQIHSLAAAYAPGDYADNPSCENVEIPYSGQVTPIIFYTDGRVKNFEILEIFFDGINYTYGESLYSKNKLSNEKFITVPVYFSKYTSTIGVRFKDSEGIYKNCIISQSSVNGAVSLMCVEPTNAEIEDEKIKKVSDTPDIILDDEEEAENK